MNSPIFLYPFTSCYHVAVVYFEAPSGKSLPGLVLPLSLFYDEPSLLDAAKYLQRCAGASNDDDENLEGLLQDDEARRSYQLSQGRSAMNAKESLGHWRWGMDGNGTHVFQL